MVLGLAVDFGQVSALGAPEVAGNLVLGVVISIVPQLDLQLVTVRQDASVDALGLADRLVRLDRGKVAAVL